MNVFLEIRTPEPVIEQRLLRAIRDQVNRALRAAATPIRRRLGQLCEELIGQTDEVVSLLQGELMGEFGITEPAQRIAAILSTIQRGIEVVHDPVMIRGTQLVGGFQFFLLKGDLSYILGLAEASYVSAPSGATIPWLEWLTQAGDKILVLDHHVTATLTPSQQKRSRTGKALMLPGGTWEVPSWASGTADNNFLTRAFAVADAGLDITKQRATGPISGLGEALSRA